MFGKRRKLLVDGAQAEAVVLESRMTGGVSAGQGGMTPVVYHLGLRVHLEDGSAFEARVEVGGAMHSAHTVFSVGDIVPIRYDPIDTSRLVVDEPRMLQEQQERKRAIDEAAIERAERKLAGLPDVDTSQPPPSDEKMLAAYQAWKSASARAKQAKAAQKQAEAGDDKREALRMMHASVTRAAEEKSARTKFNELHARRPDWSAPGGEG